MTTLPADSRQSARNRQEMSEMASEQSPVPMYSVVAPVYNEEETVRAFYERVTQVMSSTGESYELVLVNDGSRDRSFEILSAIHQEDPRVRVIDFSRNFGHQMAISAGLDYARGQAVAVIDSDLQDPPEVILEMIAKWKAGGEVIYARRATRKGETPFKIVTAAVFYRLIERITSVKIPRDTGDFRLMDRQVVNALIRMREQHRFMRGLSAWVGYRQEEVLYERHERYAGTTKYPFMKMLRFSTDAITSFSYIPLQIATTLGFILACLSLISIILAIILRIFVGAIVGQATTLILVLFMGGIQLIFLGVIGEYLGRIYDEVRARPLYLVRKVLE
ncbi:MAG TPA: glycosyltransferase [Ktedonobacteraceae bacterium]|nr:glycosyltransferase [Ktedonobacteraceae bacterium]